MRLNIFIYTAVLLIMLPQYTNAGILTLHYPPDKTVREFNLTGASVSVPGEFEGSIVVMVNGRETENIVPGRAFICFTIPLKVGMNRVEIAALRGDDQVDAVKFSVFRRSEQVALYRKAPGDFRKDNFHMKDQAVCAECHIMEPKDYDRKPVNPSTFTEETFNQDAIMSSTSTCYSCHKQITSSSYVHGPAAVWSCLSCHDPGAEVMYAVKKPDTEVCFGCHTDKKAEWENKKYIHGPVNTGKCAICHSPHSSDNPFNLFRPTWDLCVGCHAEKASGKHVLGDSFSTKGHPTKGKPDPLREGKELSCASCHNPHASDFPHLWALNAQGLFDLCRKCHYDKVE